MAIGSEARSTFLAIVKGDASQAVTEFKKLGNSVEKSTKGAEGSVGKFKTFTNGAFKELKANAGLFAAGAGAAIGAFAMKAVNDFAQLGVQVGKFSDATGLAAEDASRWIEVAGDIGIEAGTVEKAIGRLNRSIDPDKFAQYGIEIARTKDGLTDVNGTFLNVIDRLNGMKDPAEKAALAQKLLGKGWQEMAELINQGSAPLAKSLAAVSDAKVIDAKEVARAREVRAAMDKLKDAVDDLVLTVGKELAPAFSDAANAAGDLLGPLADVVSWAQKLNSYSPTNFVSWGKRLWEMAAGADESSDSLSLMTASLEEVNAFLEAHNFNAEESAAVLKDYAHWQEVATGANKSATDAVGTLNDANKVNAQRMWEAEEATRDAEKATKDYERAYRDLLGEIDQEEAWANLTRSLWELRDGTGDTAQEAREFKRDMIDMIAEMDNIPKEKKTKLLTMIDRGALDEVYRELAKLQNTKVTIPVKPVGSGLSLIGAGGKRANGGPIAAGVPYMVGERGPEMIVPNTNAMVLDAARTSRAMGGGTYNTTIVVRQVPTERELIDLINSTRRKQGAVI